MKFPGSKLLHQWDLSAQNVSVDGLLRSCQQAGLTGFAEVKLPQAVGMIFYYLGGEVNAMFRAGSVAYSGQAALDRLRGQEPGGEGAVSIFELPLDLAHLLRGITNRQKLKETVANHNDLAELLYRLEKAEHTGTLEIQTAAGSAMVLLVRGRTSNTYWESAGGLTFEKGEARQKLDEAVDGGGEVQLFLSEFSRDVWKSRHEVQGSVVSRLEKRDEPPPTEQLAAEENSQRVQAVEALVNQLPSAIQVFVFDLLTGAILARRGRGTSTLKVGLLADKVPALTQYLRDLVAAEAEDRIEAVELSTERVVMLLQILPETQEGLAIVAERTQPNALLSAALTRAARAYAERQSQQREPGGAASGDGPAQRAG